MRGGGRIAFLGGVPGLTFIRADKDGDGDFEALTSTDWNGDAKAVHSATINWNTVFGVPVAAKMVHIWCAIKDETVGAAFILRAKSTTQASAFNIRTQAANVYMNANGEVPVAADGTSYYTVVSELDGIYIHVLGWDI